MPRLLSVDQKQQRLDVSLDLKENAANNPCFLSNVITGDETWVYAYDPETKTQSSQWKSPGSPRPKKARQVRSNIKSMLICFFDQKGIVHKEFVPPGQTVNAAFYVKVLKGLWENVRRKRPDQWRNNTWLLHIRNRQTNKEKSKKELKQQTATNKKNNNNNKKTQTSIWIQILVTFYLTSHTCCSTTGCPCCWSWCTLITRTEDFILLFRVGFPRIFALTLFLR